MVLRHVYKSYFWRVNAFIHDSHGDEQDAEDVFQEALVIIFQKLRDENFEIQCSFKTFFFSVCRYLWFRQLALRKQQAEANAAFPDQEDVFQLSDDVFHAIDDSAARRLVQKHFAKLGETCQKILQLFATHVSMKEIAEILGVSEKFVKKKKFECKERLISQVKSDPLFKVYFNDE